MENKFAKAVAANIRVITQCTVAMEHASESTQADLIRKADKAEANIAEFLQQPGFWKWFNAAPGLLAACQALETDLENNGEVLVTDAKRLEVLREAIKQAL